MNDNTSATSFEAEQTTASHREGQGQSVVPRGNINAGDINSKNVVSGTQYNIERQVTYYGIPSSASHQVPLFMAADLPADFVARPKEFETLKQSLLQKKQQNLTAITSTLVGAGGYGKTTLALALCHDLDIRQRFRDGILWVTLGDQPTNIISKLKDLVYLVSGEHPNVSSLEATITVLKGALANHLFLLVIDDVWHASDLKPFIQGVPECTRLITTRDNSVLPFSTTPIPVDAMQQSEAIQLLQAEIDSKGMNQKEKMIFRQLSSQLGEWPLLLTLANGVLRERVGRLHEPLISALTYLEQALEKRGIVAFDTKNASLRDEAVTRTLEVSLLQLDTRERKYYSELAIFPEDVNIPLQTLSQYWNATGNFDELDTQDLCQRLSNLSLLLSYDLSSRSIRLHDVVRRYLQGNVASQLPTLHQQFLASYALSRWADLPSDEPYLWDHLAGHLVAAHDEKKLIATVKDIHYIAAKAILRGVFALEYDIKRATLQDPNDTELTSLNRQIRIIAHLIQHGQVPKDVAEIVLNRFYQVKELEALCKAWKKEVDHPWLSAWHSLPDLPDPAAVRTLQGHTKWVSGCAISPNGSWLLSASDDHTLKLWDATTGEVRLTLKGHTNVVNACAISPNGSWLLSASADRTLKLWDAATGEVRLTLKGHTDWVYGCAISSDGSWLLSASDDRTLKLWDAATGEVRLTLKGHTDWVNGCAISPDGSWLLSASADHTLKLWDATTGELHLTLKGHTNIVNACAISPDGSWLLSASADHTLKLWDTTTGELRLTLKGHTDIVRGCAISPDGSSFLSASDDHTLKLWDATTGEVLLTLKGHTDIVYGCAISPDGSSFLSASADHTLKLWDTTTGELRLTLEGHTDIVRGCAISPDGSSFLSASADHTLKLWDVVTSKIHLTLKGHTDWVRGCAISPDGSWLLSASADHTLKLWDTTTGELRLTLEGHTDEVHGCAISPDSSWLLSASDDDTLKLWDAITGELRLTFEGHTSIVYGCAISPDGSWLLSASADHTLKLWDAITGEPRLTFEGHTDIVRGCAISPDGSWFVSASDDHTLKLWDVTTGKVSLTFEGHTDIVRGCAISPDGSWFISASDDHTLKLWDIQHSYCLSTFYAENSLLACVFHPNGQCVIAAGIQGIYFLRIIW